jgi:hypothetical protein
MKGIWKLNLNLRRSAMTRYRLIFGSLAILIGLGMTSYAQDDDNNINLGSWLLTVTPSAPGRPAFQAFVSFASGGVFIESGQNDHAIPSAGIQQGTWRWTGHRRISSTQMSFIYGQNGAAIGTLKVQATYEFRGANKLTGHGQLSTCDLNGANCQTLPGCAGIEGKRIEVEEPDCP